MQCLHLAPKTEQPHLYLPKITMPPPEAELKDDDDYDGGW